MEQESILLNTLRSMENKIDSIDSRVRHIEQRVNNGLSENVQWLVEQTRAQERRLAEVEEKHQRERVKREASEKRWRVVKVILSVGISVGLLAVAIVGL